jgi:hypothetical protein
MDDFEGEDEEDEGDNSDAEVEEAVDEDEDEIEYYEEEVDESGEEDEPVQCGKKKNKSGERQSSLKAKRSFSTLRSPGSQKAFEIQFDIVHNDRTKEFSISSDTSWTFAQILIGSKLLHDPACLTLGYINPFKPKGPGKAVPSSLESEKEWIGLINHVKQFRAEQVVKNQGKGAALKSYCIRIVNLTKEEALAKTKTKVG